MPAAVLCLLIGSDGRAQYRQVGITFGSSQFDRENADGQTVGRGNRYGLIFRQDLNDRFSLGLDISIFSKEMLTYLDGSDEETLAERKLNSIGLSFIYRLLRQSKADYFTPYIGGGAGFHSVGVEVQGVNLRPRSESQFGVHALAGLWIKVPRFPIRLIGEVQMGQIFTQRRDRDLSLYKSAYAGIALLLMK